MSDDLNVGCLGRWRETCARLFSRAAYVFGGTPKTATGTVALPGTGDSVIVRWSHLVLGVSFLVAAVSRADDAATANSMTVIIAAGAAGTDEYRTNFESWAGLWTDACARGGAKSIVIGLGPTNETVDLDRLKQALAAESTNSPASLWLVMLGHGTFDGIEARFNLRGPDLTATDLAALLQPFTRPLAVIDCSSCSAPFMAKLSGPGRVIITATRSGYEQNFSLFGRYMAESVANPAADLDKDGETSLLEAFLMASRQVAEFYETAGRIATEHALLDDNGDGLGTPATWFQGVHAVKRAKNGAAADGIRAHQFCLVRGPEERRMPPELRARRDELELAIAKLRDQKSKLAAEDYYHQLEVLLVEYARISAGNAGPD